MNTLHPSRKFPAVGVPGKDAQISPLRRGTTLGVSLCRWGALLAADGFQFLPRNCLYTPKRVLYEDDDNKVAKVFKDFCSKYEISDAECLQLMIGMKERKDFHLITSNGQKIFIIDTGSGCFILAAIAGQALLGEDIILKLNNLAGKLILMGKVLTIEDCVDFSSTILNIDFKGKADLWGLPKNFDMSTFTCSLIFVTCASNVNHSFPKAAFVDKNTHEIFYDRFLFVGQGTEVADKVFSKHWSRDMTQPAALSGMKEAFQAASFSKMSGGELTFALLSIDDSLFKIIKASTFFTTGNIPWDHIRYGADHYYTNHWTKWRGSWCGDDALKNSMNLSAQHRYHLPEIKKSSKDGESDRLRFGSSSMQGWPNRMEDAYAAFPDLHNSTSFFGVYDGHGGDLVAKFCAKYLHQELLKQEAYSAGDLGTCIRRSFLRMDDMMHGIVGWTELAVSRGGSSPLTKAQIYYWKGPYSSGSTACTAIIRNNRLVVANASDSRCVISRKGQAFNLSREHRPELEVEKKRILKAGGFVHAGRINGKLNVARAIGDIEFKQHKHLTAEEQIVTASPEIIPVELCDADDFMVLASDGIWVCVSSQKLVDFIHEQLNSVSNLSLVCERVLDRCLAPSTAGGGGCDNMTMILVQFKKPIVKSGSLSRSYQHHHLK